MLVPVKFKVKSEFGAKGEERTVTERAAQLFFKMGLIEPFGQDEPLEVKEEEVIEEKEEKQELETKEEKEVPETKEEKQDVKVTKAPVKEEKPIEEVKVKKGKVTKAPKL